MPTAKTIIGKPFEDSGTLATGMTVYFKANGTAAPRIPASERLSFGEDREKVGPVRRCGFHRPDGPTSITVHLTDPR